MKKNFKVTFKPDNRSIDVSPNNTILKAADLAGVYINAPCGRNGICNKCRVKILSGDVSGQKLADGTFLACRTRIRSDITVVIPEISGLSKPKILERGTQNPIDLHPAIQKIYLELTPPTITDQRTDLERVTDYLKENTGKEFEINIDLLRVLPIILRESEFKITVVIYRNKIVRIEKGDTRDTLYGVAVDIGTTTVAGLILNLNDGQVLASASQINPQTRHGDDVISRIDFSETSDGLDILGDEIRQCINEIIADLCKKLGIKPDDIYEITLAGNTTMNHFFLKVPGSGIARAPYVPVYRDSLNTQARKVDLKINSHGNVFILPNIAGYVGADTSAAIVAAGMFKTEKIQLLVDIGTNGEIVLGNKDRLIACSAAAGPAFEGARLSCGMSGVSGAIERVSINNDVEFSVIGGKIPKGICGSGVIDLVSELLRIGVIDETGRLLSPEELDKSISDSIKSRIRKDENFYSFILDQQEGGPAIVFTQKDIREVQLAKGAIYAGIQTLLKLYGITENNLHAVLLAGAFGNFILSNHARRVGLLPNIPDEKIQFIGNAAIEGAVRVLLSQKDREIVDRVARQVEYVELSARPDFQEEFMMAMMFGG